MRNCEEASVCDHSNLFLQHRLARRAVTDLASLYGTRYRFGSIISTICKFQQHYISFTSSHLILIVSKYHFLLLLLLEVVVLNRVTKD